MADLNSTLELLSLTKTGEVHGGDISQSYIVQTAERETRFLKYHPNPLPNMFQLEADQINEFSDLIQDHQLKHLISVPEVHSAGDQHLLLSHISRSSWTEDSWHNAGEGLAKIHQVAQKQFGWKADNYCGTTVQKNNWHEDGYQFFADQRLLFQAELARNSGLMSSSEVKKVEQLCYRLENLIPRQQPALIHGDLWSGNIMVDAQGLPVIFDPAAHNGWPEADLAMTRLFGGFTESFYRAYKETRTLEAGFEDRVSLYNLYHQLNHLNLFGGSWHAAVMTTLKQWQ